MGVLGHTWCFCNGGGKSEKMKGAIFSGKGPAMATISGHAETATGTGFLIHRNLLLTTHVNLPSVSVAETTEIRLQNGVHAVLLPHRFFITSSVLDLTIVGLDNREGDHSSSCQLHHLHYLKTTCSKPNLDLGNIVYLLGHNPKKELTVGEGKVVIATDNLIKLSIEDQTWNPGSAGFDPQGNLAFMICDPMKLATSPNAKSSSTSTSSSSSSRKKDRLMQFGIPMPIICDWLNQHWEGNLDELSKPGLRGDHASTSFTMKRIFKPSEAEHDSIHTDLTPNLGPIHLGNTTNENQFNNDDPNKAVSSDSVKGTAAGGESEVESSSSPVNKTSEIQNGYYSSEGETTMYSAETAESRNIPSPKEGRFQQQPVRRSQSCVNYRYGSPSVQRTPAARKAGSEKQRSPYTQGRKLHLQGAASNRINDYYSPTVSSIMKKRNNMISQKQPPTTKPPTAAGQSSPRWMF